MSFGSSPSPQPTPSFWNEPTTNAVSGSSNARARSRAAPSCAAGTPRRRCRSGSGAPSPAPCPSRGRAPPSRDSSPARGRSRRVDVASCRSRRRTRACRACPGRPWKYAKPRRLPRSLEVVQEQRELAQVEDRLVARRRVIQSGGPSSTPSARAVRSSCRASYESTHSASSCSDEEPRVRVPVARPRAHESAAQRAPDRRHEAAGLRSRTDTSAVGERLRRLEPRRGGARDPRRRAGARGPRSRRVGGQPSRSRAFDASPTRSWSSALPAHERLVDPNVLLPVEPDVRERAARRGRATL